MVKTIWKYTVSRSRASCLGPQLLLQDLTLGAVPIPTRVVGAAGEAAVGTHLEMPAQPLGAAGDDVAHGPGLGSGEAEAVRVIA